MQYLRLSTASQVISLGYLLDSTDGNTEETGLTIANTDIKLRKHAATSMTNKNSGGATHMSNGIYHTTLNATDTNTLGRMELYCHVAGGLAVKIEFMVLPATSYDALMTNGLNNLAATSIVSAGAITTLTGAVVNVTNLATYTGNTKQTGDNFARVGAPVGASISADIAAVKSVIGTPAGASVSADIADVPTVAEFNARTIASASYALEATSTTIAGYLDTEIAAILVDTGTAIPGLIAALNDISTADILASGDVDGYDLEEAMKILLAALAGKASGLATTTAVFRAADDSKDRITATVDADGNRSAVTLDGAG